MQYKPPWFLKILIHVGLIYLYASWMLFFNKVYCLALFERYNPSQNSLIFGFVGAVLAYAITYIFIVIVLLAVQQNKEGNNNE